MEEPRSRKSPRRRSEMFCTVLYADWKGWQSTKNHVKMKGRVIVSRKRPEILFWEVGVLALLQCWIKLKRSEKVIFMRKCLILWKRFTVFRSILKVQEKMVWGISVVTSSRKIKEKKRFIRKLSLIIVSKAYLSSEKGFLQFLLRNFTSQLNPAKIAA